MTMMVDERRKCDYLIINGHFLVISVFKNPNIQMKHLHLVIASAFNHLKSEMFVKGTVLFLEVLLNGMCSLTLSCQPHALKKFCNMQMKFYFYR